MISTEQLKNNFGVVLLAHGHSSAIMMGVETPIPPDTMNAAAADGAPPRRINASKEKIETSLPRRA